MDIVEIQNEIQSHVNSYVTVLLSLQRKGERDALSAVGSGVFVEMGGYYGILTAAHVINDILEADLVGIHLYDKLGSPRIRTSDILNIKFPDGSAEDEGPDLGIMLLPQYEVEKIRPYKKFFSITEQRSFIGNSPPQPDKGIWFVQGFPGKLIENSPPEGPYTEVFNLKGVCAFSRPKNVFTHNDFDYVDMNVDIKVLLNSKDLYDFRGMNGGGLWYVPIDEQTSKVMFNELTLIGTAFYQDVPIPWVSPDFDSEVTVSGLIRCHGWISLYGVLFDSATKALRNPNHPISRVKPEAKNKRGNSSI